MVDGLTDQLVQGVAGDNAVARILSQYLPMILQALMGRGLNALSGTGGTNYPLSAADLMSGRTLPHAVHAERYANSYGAVFKPMTAGMTTDMVANIYQSMGYSPAAAQLQARSGMGRVLATAINFSEASPSGLDSIAKAMYARRGMFTGVNGGPESFFAQVAGAKELAERAQYLVQSGAMGTMTTRDTGQLMGELISTGRYDSFGSQYNTRYDRLSRDVRQYGKGLERLQQVIDGDVPKVLATLDAIFGGSSLNMTASEFNRLASNIQSTVTGAGISIQSLTELGAAAQSYIAPIGGTQAQAMRVAQDVAYWTANGTGDSMLSQGQMQVGLTALRAEQQATGVDRYMNAAYRAFAEASGMDAYDSSTEQAFWRAYGDNARTNEGAMNFIEQLNPGMSADLMYNFINGRETTRLMQSSGIGGQLFEDTVQSVRTATEANLRDLTAQLGLSEGALTANMGRDDIRDAVKRAKGGFLAADDQEALAAFETKQDDMLWRYGGDKASELEAASRNIESRQQRLQEVRNQQTMELLTKNLRRPGGMSGVMQQLAQNPDTDIAGLLGSAAGINIDELRKLDVASFDALANGTDDEIRAALKDSSITVDQIKNLREASADLVEAFTADGPGVWKQAPGTERDGKAYIAYMKQRRATVDKIKSGNITKDEWDSYVAQTSFSNDAEKQYLDYLIKEGHSDATELAVVGPGMVVLTKASSKKVKAARQALSEYGTAAFDRKVKDYETALTYVKAMPGGTEGYKWTDKVAHEYASIKDAIATNVSSSGQAYIAKRDSMTEEARKREFETLSEADQEAIEAIDKRISKERKSFGDRSNEREMYLDDLYKGNNLVSATSVTTVVDQILDKLKQLLTDGIKIKD